MGKILPAAHGIISFSHFFFFFVFRLRKPQDGLFTGTVDAYDTSNNTYRITFDRVGLGTHSIPDIEVSERRSREICHNPELPTFLEGNMPNK